MSDAFGRKVRELREKKCMTLRALARSIGVSAPFLSDLEHGRRNTDKIPELAMVLGCTEEELRVHDERDIPARVDALEHAVLELQGQAKIWRA